MVGAITFILGCFSAYSMKFFEIADTILNNSLIIGGLILALFVGWSWSMDKFFKEANVQSSSIKTIFTLIVKYIAPAAIIYLGLSMHGLF